MQVFSWTAFACTKMPWVLYVIRTSCGQTSKLTIFKHENFNVHNMILRTSNLTWKRTFFSMFYNFCYSFQNRRNSYVVRHLYNLENSLYMKKFHFPSWTLKRGAIIWRTKSMGSITCWTFVEEIYGYSI